MGSGKTTIGHRVAKLLGMDFLDCDRELEAQTGASVSLIFDLEGEGGFREREENCEMLSRSGLVVYLQTSVEQQFRRLRRDRSRPLLQSGDRKQKLAELAAARNPLYEKLADIAFQTQNRSPDIAARQLADAILSYRADAGANSAQTQDDDT